MRARIEGLLFFYDWATSFEELPPEDVKSLLLAMVNFRRDGVKPPEFTGAAKIAASFIFPQIERSIQAAVCGSKGGTAKAANSSATTIANSSAISQNKAKQNKTNTKQNETKTKTETETILRQNQYESKATQGETAQSTEERRNEMIQALQL